MPCSKLSDLDRILSTHYLVSGKICPGIWGWNTARWNYDDGNPMNGPDGKPQYNNLDNFNNFKKHVWNYLVGYNYVTGEKVKLDKYKK